jgi:hypothetical protein
MSIGKLLCKIGLHNYNRTIIGERDFYKCSRPGCAKSITMDHIEPFKCEGCEFSKKCK